jgi:hypothetical protein
MHRLFLVALLYPLISVPAIAQQGQPSTVPDAPSPNQQPPQTAPGQQNPIQSSVAMVLTIQKKSVIFPDLATNKRQLSSWDKCKLGANTSVAFATVGAALLGAGVGQLRNAPKGYGQGFEGYGKRFGAGMARSASYNAFGPCLIASVTHEDPRFFVRRLGFRDTLKYAAVRLVMTRNDEGEQVVNYSGLVGTLAAEALANTYYPNGSRGVGSTLIRYSTDMGTRYAGHLLRQYLPLIDKRLKLSSQ